MILFRKETGIKPLVSIVICTYNRAQLICKAVDSVLSQKINFPIEILIGDDFSNDDTWNILLDYQKRYPEIFTLILQEKNLGIGKNWASVMKLVQGKYVALCDDDDYWHNEEKLQLQVNIMENDKSIGLVHTNYRFKSSILKKYKDVDNSNKNVTDYFKAIFEGRYTILTSTTVFRNSLIKEYVNLDDYILYDFPIQDWETWMLIAKYTKFYHIPLSTVTYHFTPDSVSRSLDYNSVIDKYKKEKLMYKYICNKFPNDLIFDEIRYDNHVKQILLHHAFVTKDFKKAHEAGKLQKIINFKTFSSKNKNLFYFYCKLKKIINFLHEI